MRLPPEAWDSSLAVVVAYLTQLADRELLARREVVQFARGDADEEDYEAHWQPLQWQG